MYSGPATRKVVSCVRTPPGSLCVSAFLLLCVNALGTCRSPDNPLFVYTLHLYDSCCT